MLLAVISWQVAVDGPLLEVDTAVRDTVRHLRRSLDSTLLNHFGVALSDLGGGVPAVPVLLGCAGLAAWLARRGGRPRWWTPVPVAVLAAVLIPLLVVPAKAWFARPGPFGAPLAADQWGWYPSGHTATSSIAYGTAALLLARVLPERPGRQVRAAAVLVCLGVGFGLVWSDFHWLLDVLASWCLAGLLLLGLHPALPHLLPDPTGPSDPTSPTGKADPTGRTAARPRRPGPESDAPSD
ncbi:phosphatase PAP2 family protein [Streptomyces sp. TLI_171]|uniref:phosphatase PAP2 family protein n=1 Tax=Streptomyces sp. TLI_171 TaxID=1938859 RepID=UPI000C37274D|nr:phosphatase PAP2 family protein [Streptomyces sp. TLI_171]RKE21419.1 undecaprenyl-diphosphatase [Streptomyces sp. TLI_171]